MSLISRDLNEVSSLLAGKPQLKMLYFTVQMELRRLFTCSSFSVHSFRPNKTTYLFGFRKNTFIKSQLIVGCDGTLATKEFIEGFKLFAKEYKLFKMEEELIISGDQELTDFIETVYSDQNHTIEQYPCRMFYMTLEQKELFFSSSPPSLPDGYILERASPADAEIITSTWIHAGDGDLEQTIEKLRAFPSSCIHIDGKPIGFEMIDPNGHLNHLFVFPEYRGNRLGAAVEDDLMRKCIRADIPVYKCVETFNKSVISAAERSPFWTKYAHPDGSDIIFMYLCVIPNRSNGLK